MNWPNFDFPTDLQENSEDIGARGVLVDRNSGKVKSRVGLMFSLYFAEPWTRAARQGLLDVLTEYLKEFGRDATHYQYAGQKRLRKYTWPGLPPGYDEAIDATEHDRVHMFVQCRNPDSSDDPTDTLYMGMGDPVDDIRTRSSGVKFYLPIKWLEEPDYVAGFVTRCAGYVHAIHGSGGLGALSSPGLELSTKAYWLPWLQAYPALEYDSSGSYLARVSGVPDAELDSAWRLARASNWLTIVGNDLVACVGGRQAIEDQLIPGMKLYDYAGGVIIRASERPVLGNAANGGIPDGYRVAARIIKPVRFEGYGYGVIQSPPGYADGKEAGVRLTLDWLRRFD